MLDVVLLGTSGTVPLPRRWLTSCFLRANGKCVLIDCGEGTQIALNSHKLSFKSINTILLTHYHADHISGLPGLLLTMAKSDRTEPIAIYGPKGLEEVLDGVMKLAKYVPFPILYKEYLNDEETIELDNMKIKAFKVKHSVPCYGYKVTIERGRKFDVDKAKALNLPVNYWRKLQKGEEVEYEGNTYTPDMVLLEERKGIKFVYVTDTRPTEEIKEMSLDADLLIAEGMYGDKEKEENAIKNKHMMMQESALIAKEANVKELWFTHYSPSVVNPDEYKDEIKEIFENVVISRDGEKKTLKFEDEESSHV